MSDDYVPVEAVCQAALKDNIVDLKTEIIPTTDAVNKIKSGQITEAKSSFSYNLAQYNSPSEVIFDFTGKSSSSALQLLLSE